MVHEPVWGTFRPSVIELLHNVFLQYLLLQKAFTAMFYNTYINFIYNDIC